MVAIRKFIGGCLTNINMRNQYLGAVVGGMDKVHKTMNVVVASEHDTEA